MPSLGPAADPLLIRQKWTKPLTPRPAISEGTDAGYRRTDQLATLTQGPQDDRSVHPGTGRQASENGKGVGKINRGVTRQLTFRAPTDYEIFL